MSNEAIDCNDINKMAVAMATDDSINCQQADGAHAFPDRVDENTSDTLSLPAAAVTPLTMAVIADDQWQLVPMAKRFGQSMAIFLGIWSIGYFGASFAWILLGVALTTLREHLDYEKRVKMAVKRDIALDERNIISSAVQYLPSWVHFPDRERVEWINRIIRQLWPFIDEFAKKIIREQVEPNIVAALPSYMKSFRFDRVDLGSVPFRISSIKTYHENTSREEIIIDMDFNYAGNCDMNISVKGLKAGIKDLHISGTMRIELRPLLKEPPIVGGVSFYFLQEPTIEFNMTNMADILDIPGISDILRKVIRDQLAKMCVLPNKMAFPLSTSVEKRDLKCRPPLGAVRIELFEAKQLRKADVGLLGMGKSDPYCTIAVGEKEFKTPTIKNTISPKWNFACEAIVHFALGQDIKFEVMDEDQGSKDDFLGQASIHLDELMTHGHMEGWLKLEETPTGLIRYRATWMNVESDFDQMLPIQRANSEKVRRKYPKLCDDLDLSLGSVALVCVYVDSAESLPLVKGHEASSYALLSIGNCAQKTMVKIENASPVFEELFYFLITDPTTESDLRIELLDSKRDDALIGYVSYSMTSLLEAKDHQNFEPLPLRGRATGATFHAFVQLTLLCDCYQNSLPKQVSTIVEEDDAAPGPPSLEDMIFSTVKPMIQISGDSPKKVDASQQPRVTSAGDQDYSKTPDIAGGDQNSNNFPKMKITLTREERLVTLVIHRVVNMTSVEGGKGSERAPDPYVKISCLPGKPKDMERRTAVHRNTRDPVFEETFEFSMDAMKGELVAFEAEVCSKSSGSALSNVFNGRKRHLGTAIIELSDLGSETSVSQWYDIDHDPN